MKVLIVHAHPEPASFNSALKDTAVATLTAQGHEVKVSDLYGTGFKTIPDADDFTGLRKDRDRLQVDREHREQEYQYETGTYPPDVAAEQAKVLWCDLMIFQFPIWWFVVLHARDPPRVGRAGHGPWLRLLWPVNNGIFHYLGFTPLPPFIAFAPRLAEASEREGLFQTYAERLRTVETTEPLFVHSREDYGPDQRPLPLR
ncbi:NAD(P)H-dependent oxidoreductase [Streptomyces sp. NPDC093589]|uniref:NAD(P)H-dependent oxidoreductase n=1 Tax=Streptomyces sp. NPDC093589 TaxID=3366043 RepID=UPI00380E8E60